MPVILQYFRLRQTAKLLHKLFTFSLTQVSTAPPAITWWRFSRCFYWNFDSGIDECRKLFQHVPLLPFPPFLLQLWNYHLVKGSKINLMKESDWNFIETCVIERWLKLFADLEIIRRGNSTKAIWIRVSHEKSFLTSISRVCVECSQLFCKKPN